MKYNHNLHNTDTYGAYITGMMRKIANGSYLYEFQQNMAR